MSANPHLLSSAMSFVYPNARRSDVADDYHGNLVADPYRWTEDPNDPETQEFVRRQNELTMPYLASLPEVSDLKKRIAELWDTPRTGAPQKRGTVVVWAAKSRWLGRAHGLLDQPQFLVSRDGSKPELLLDPNTMSEDGAVAVTEWTLSPDGALMAYTIAESARLKVGQ